MRLGEAHKNIKMIGGRLLLCVCGSHEAAEETAPSREVFVDVCVSKNRIENGGAGGIQRDETETGSFTESFPVFVRPPPIEA